MMTSWFMRVCCFDTNMRDLQLEVFIRPSGFMRKNLQFILVWILHLGRWLEYHSVIRLSQIVQALYYIARGQKTLGPCSKDDLRNFLAYGSIKDSDLVKREHEEQWRPVSTLLELHAEGQISADGLTARPSRRRVARYRDYDRVPYSQRGGAVRRW